MAGKKNEPRYREYRNSKIHQNFEVGDCYEAGIMLRGTEIKSVRDGLCQLADSFARFDGGNLMLYHMHIQEYSRASWSNHDPYRPRQLLLKAKELRKLRVAVDIERKSIVPVKAYFKGSLLKVEVAVCTGKKLHDKRQDLLKKEHTREAERAIRDR